MSNRELVGSALCSQDDTSRVSIQGLVLTARAISVGYLLFVAGCYMPAGLDKDNWSTPKEVSRSQDSLGTSFSLYKWNQSLLAVTLDAGVHDIYFLQGDEASWKAIRTTLGTDYPNYWTWLTCDAISNRFVRSSGTMMGDSLQVDFLTGGIAGNGMFIVNSRGTWAGDKDTLFGKTAANVTLSKQSDKPVHPIFAGGSIHDSEFYIPYCITGETYRDRALITAEGPFANGVFHSADSGKTWEQHELSRFYALSAEVHKTDQHYYYIADKYYEHELWFSSRPVAGGAWSSPATITSTFAHSGVNRKFVTASDGDTVHACWLDRRHEKRTRNPFYPWLGNWEVAYSHRKDDDAQWSKSIILSKGLQYAFAPVISVEGQRIVIAWAGAWRAERGHTEFKPNDIYYATSKNCGEDWTDPMRVTENLKTGVTAGEPRVALHNGVIHLFYVQGKLNFLSGGGLTLVNQPPWPIYYTHRAFPE